MTKIERNMLIELCEEDLEELQKNMENDKSPEGRIEIPDIFD